MRVALPLGKRAAILIHSEDKYINRLIDKAKEKAAAVKSGEIKTIEDLIWVLKHWWSRHYNRPLKDPVLESYEIPELLFEFFLFANLDAGAETNKIISDNKEELQDLFKDFEPHSIAEAKVTPEEKQFLTEEWSMNENDFLGGNANGSS
jgi:hypothetical protein